MAQKPIEFKTPPKGVVKDLAFSDIKADSAVDALNVLPFDRQGRMRANQRAGTSKLYGSVMGSGTQGVLGMLQTTIALDPATIDPSVTLVNDNFSGYANGILTTVSAGVYRSMISSAASSGHVAGIAAGTDATRLQWTSPNILWAGTSAGAGNQFGSVQAYTPALVVGSAYIVRITARDFAAGGTGAFKVLWRIDKSTWNNTATVCYAEFSNSSVAIKTGSSLLATINYGETLADGVDHTLEIRVNGDVFQAWVNGTFRGTTNSSSGNSFSGVAFGMRQDGSVGYSGKIKSFAVMTGVTLASYRRTNVIYSVGGNIYVGTLASFALATGGTSQLADTVRPGMASSTGNAYFVDGFNIRKLIIQSQLMTTYAATAGTAPVNCQLACMYRDRLVLAAPRDNPQNFFFSRIGTHTDWDYSQTDSAAAFAGNASIAGRIGEPIVALMPFSDDVLLIGGDHNLWAMRGDPTDGGSIDLVSDAIGILGQYAFTKSPDGTIYFAGTGGFYRMAPGGSPPENLSNGKWGDFFRQINRGTSYVNVNWDADKQGAYIFVVPVNSGTATHLWYDGRTGGFWPIQFPNSHGPLVGLVYDGDGATDRVTLLGGRAGFVQKLTETDKSDDGTAISSQLTFAPYLSSNITESILEWVDVILGEPQTGFAGTDYNATVQVFAGSTVEQALSSPRLTRTKTFTAPRRQFRWLNRTRGNAFLVKVSNSTLNKTWNLETIVGMVMDGGLVRRR
jgi:hypothetical protein